jgi:hypothetical protein
MQKKLIEEIIIGRILGSVKLVPLLLIKKKY